MSNTSINIKNNLGTKKPVAHGVLDKAKKIQNWKKSRIRRSADPLANINERALYGKIMSPKRGRKQNPTRALNQMLTFLTAPQVIEYTRHPKTDQTSFSFVEHPKVTQTKKSRFELNLEASSRKKPSRIRRSTFVMGPSK